MDVPERTVQEAAKLILEREGHPLSSKELAKIALRQRLVKSEAMDPERSFENTIDQNIKNGREPKLVEVRGTNNEPLVGLPGWKDKGIWWEEIRITIPLELFQKLQLAQQAGLKPSFDETVVFLLESGLKAETPNIKDGLIKQLEKL